MKDSNIDVLITKDGKQSKYTVKKNSFKEFYLQAEDDEHVEWGVSESTIKKLFSTLEEDLRNGFCDKFEIITKNEKEPNYMQNLLKKYGRS